MILTDFLYRLLSRRRFAALANTAYERIKLANPADALDLGKARNFIERHREILSDPLNLLINRVPQAGYLDGAGNVFLHNGIKVPIIGPFAYYSGFSDILILNRGVHEPLEEFCFQTVLAKLVNKTDPPRMLELGAYWGHYSMWLKSNFPNSSVTLVEPDVVNLQAGQHNFSLNGLEGTFINSFVCKGHFSVDAYMRKNGCSKLTILHADIQGFEVDMLQDCVETLDRGAVTYLFISTHTKKLHDACLEEINRHGYLLEVSSEPDRHTTSSDGFILATVDEQSRVFNNFNPMGRIDIAYASGNDLALYIKALASEK